MSLKTTLCHSSAALAFAVLPISATGATVVALTADVGSSSASGFNGNVPALLSDTFAYDIDNPTSVLPDQAYTNAPPGDGFHGSSPSPNAVLDLSGGTLTLNPGESFVIDIYGRADCCTDRDDNFRVEFYSGGAGDGVLGSLVSTMPGLGIANGAPHHLRVTYTGAAFDSINFVGTVNNFTLMEVRAGVIPEPSSALLGLFGLVGLALRRRR